MQPDKVNVVPLDVHLDKSYSYELRGKVEHHGRPAWRIGTARLLISRSASMPATA